MQHTLDEKLSTKRWIALILALIIALTLAVVAVPRIQANAADAPHPGVYEGNTDAWNGA